MSYLGNPLSSMNFPVDYFTGDGTTSTFTLSYTPASATSILVYIGGVKQVASTNNPAYYVVGNQLVLTGTPAAYTPIEVNYLGIASQVNVPSSQSITQSMLSLQIANTFVTNTITNGTQNVITLVAPPVSSNSLIVTANGVVQYDYYVNGSNLYLNFTPPAGTRIRAQGIALTTVGVPNDASITSAKLSSNLTFTGTSTFAANVVIAGNLTVAGNTTYVNTEVANNGLYSIGSFLGPYTSGIVMDYSGSTGRISVGSGAGLTFYNGGVGSTALMTLNSSGNVGIGYPSPNSLLELRRDTTTAGQEPVITLTNRSTGTSSYYTGGIWGAAYRDVRDPAYIAGIDFYRDSLVSGLASAGSIRFYASAGGETLANTRANNEVMRITSVGNVGIGTTGPVAPLEVSTTNNTLASFRYKSSTPTQAYITVVNNNSANSGLALAHNSGGDVFVGNQTNNPMIFGTNNTERMRIDANGKFLIATTSAFSSYGALQIVSGIALSTGSSSGGYINGTSTGGTEYGYLSLGANYNIGSAGQVALATDGANALLLGTNNTERMRIDGSGSVLINYTSAGYPEKFGVSGVNTSTITANFSGLAEAYTVNTQSSRFAYFQSGTQMAWTASTNSAVVGAFLVDINAYNGSAATNVYFGATAGSGGGGTPANFVIGRRTGVQNWAESIRIDSSGKLLVGTTSGIEIVNVSGNLQTSGGVVSPLFYINRQYASSGYDDITTNGTTLAINEMGAGSLNSLFNGGFGPLSYQSAQNEPMSWNYVRIWARATNSVGGTYSTTNLTLSAATYFYATGWTQTGGTFTWNGTDSARGYRWIVFPWIPFSAWANGGDVPGLGIQLVSGAVSGTLGLRVGEVYLQFKN